ncbi:enoyl-CoA hydratase-related protein [Ferrimonas balearica]|uniref:enoyl-CoA hydratase-related protein n=1 Tax=Ferrimonas balearica TaxID=44012 RepID=UPI001C9983BD|nr:enoyl-CoA hydratase-related protein [Ferrimonas balearica]MBY5990694.1 enoyl-CoA hydratase/isomerase family protein [Ferrimonas balearica]
MAYQYIELTQQGPLARLTLNRPDKHNAFNAETIAELLDALARVAEDNALSLLVLDARGKHFCAGADLAWMKAQAQMDAEANLADARQLAELMRRLDTLPIPVLAQVQGAAFGGALGLIACADVVVAQPDSLFCLSEVKLGLIPAAISPYVSRAIGPRQMRRYALTAERFDGAQAQALGLVHELAEQPAEAAQPLIDALLANGPQALRAGKSLLALVSDAPIDEALCEETARRIAAIRVTPEGQEGLQAFFDKRPPAWQHSKRQEAQ